jgi:hypothetical protein
MNDTPENNQENQLHKSLLFKFVNTLAGSRIEFQTFLIISLGMGFVYSFKVWDANAILVIFGMVLPVLYIFSLYKLMQHQAPEEIKKTKISRWARSKGGNLVMRFVDAGVTVLVGYLTLEGTLDFLIVRILLTMVFPPLYLTAVHAILNRQKEGE